MSEPLGMQAEIPKLMQKVINRAIISNNILPEDEVQAA
jgi:hypothetical protein